METILQEIRDLVQEVPKLASTSETFEALEMGLQLAPLARTLGQNNYSTFTRIAAMAVVGAMQAEIEDAEEEVEGSAP